MAIAKSMGSGWHSQSVRHSNARRFGRAGGKYSSLSEKLMKGNPEERQQAYKAFEGRAIYDEPSFVAIDKTGKRTLLYTSDLNEAKAFANLLFKGKGGKLEKVKRKFGGKNLTKTQEKNLKTKIKENKQIPLTHPRKIGKNKGLYYLKAGNIHKVDVKKDLNIKAQHKRSPKEDSWRGDNKPSTF